MVPDNISHKRWWQLEELATRGYRDFDREDAACLQNVAMTRPKIGPITEGVQINHDYVAADRKWGEREWKWEPHLETLKEIEVIQNEDTQPWFFHDLQNTEAMETTENYLQPIGSRRMRKPMARPQISKGKISRLIAATTEDDTEASSWTRKESFDHLGNGRKANPGIFANLSRTTAIGRKSGGSSPLNGESSRLSFLILRLANISECLEQGSIPLSTKANLSRLFGEYPTVLEPWVDIDWDAAKNDRSKQCTHFKLDFWGAREIFEENSRNDIAPIVLHALLGKTGKGATEAYWQWPRIYELKEEFVTKRTPITEVFVSRWLEAETIREMEDCLELCLCSDKTDKTGKKIGERDGYVGTRDKLVIPKRWASGPMSEWDLRISGGQLVHFMIERVRLLFLPSTVTAPMVAGKTI